MNQFMSNLVCEGFHHMYGHENAEMQNRKFDDVTLQYSLDPVLLNLITSLQEKEKRNNIFL